MTPQRTLAAPAFADGDEPQSELHLLAGARDGDPDSFEALCAPHLRRLLKTAFNVTGNREDAEDALQDSLMKAFVRIKDFLGASSFSTWLTRIVINSALMIRRKRRTARHIFLDDLSEDRLTLDVPDAAADPAQIFFARERRMALCNAIRDLRPNLRSAVEAGYLQDFSMEETAKALNISTGAAKARLFQARAALRRSATLRLIAQSRTGPAA